MNPNRKGYTKPGTKHERVVRKSPSGRPQKLDVAPAPAWHELVVPGPKPAGVRRPFTVDVPPRMYELTESKDIPGPLPDQPSRRDRRPVLIASAKAARKAARAATPTKARKGRAA